MTRLACRKCGKFTVSWDAHSAYLLCRSYECTAFYPNGHEDSPEARRETWKGHQDGILTDDDLEGWMVSSARISTQGLSQLSKIEAVILGLPVNTARTWAEANGLKVRVERLNGRALFGLQNLDVRRVNVWVQDGIVDRVAGLG